MSSREFRALALGLSLLVPASARAQTPLSGIFPSLIDQITLAPPSGVGVVNHSAHFSVEGVNGHEDPTSLLFNREIISQLATFPTGSSSGGFSCTYDPKLDTCVRNSRSFGPSFAERALTGGRRQVTFGANFQFSQYNWFNGINNQNGDLNFYLRHNDCCSNAFFEGDLILVSLKLKLSTNTTSMFVTYGLTDKLDVSLTVPIVHASLEATTTDTVQRLATAGTTIHQFDNGTATKDFHGAGSATGIGDLLIRAKYRLTASKGGGTAIEVDARLPTGDSENLLGAGAGAATILFIGSGEHGKFGPHVNIGYTFSGDSSATAFPNEFVYRGGVEYALNPRVTISGDFVGRSLVGADHLVLGNTTHSYTTINGVQSSIVLTEFVQTHGTLNMALAAIGGKFNVMRSRKFLVSANVLLPVNWAGFRARVTPVFGFDYSF
jgi:hypothetical protein